MTLIRKSYNENPEKKDNLKMNLIKLENFKMILTTV